jgi:hypothetical protein
VTPGPADTPVEVGRAGQVFLTLDQAPHRISSAWGRRFARRLPAGHAEAGAAFAVIDVAFFVDCDPALPERPSIVRRTAYLLCGHPEDSDRKAIDGVANYTVVATDSRQLVPGGPAPAAEQARCVQLCTEFDPRSLNWNHHVFRPPHTKEDT